MTAEGEARGAPSCGASAEDDTMKIVIGREWGY